MHLSNTLFVGATLIAATIAQTPTTTSLHFTTIPTSLVAGVQQTIGWAGGNGNSVNIILQQGLASNLQDVPIPPIASGAQGNSTTWTPPKSLPDAGNYALRIEQGEDTVNYSGMLQLFGGCSTCPTNAIAALASASASKTSTGSATTSSPSSTASATSKSAAGTSVVSSGSKSSNSTSAAGSSGNSTTTGSSTNSTLSTGSNSNMTVSGTNSTANSTTNSTTNSTANSTANSTLSSAKLQATSSKTSSSSSSTSSSTSSSLSESTSSSTGSGASPSPTKQSSGVTVAASNFALVLCAIVGIIYLG